MGLDFAVTVSDVILFFFYDWQSESRIHIVKNVVYHKREVSQKGKTLTTTRNLTHPKRLTTGYKSG